MNIYYKRKVTFEKYPFNQEIAKKWVEYSLSRKKFKCFLTSDASLDMNDRIKLIANHLKVKKNKIKLIKI